MELLRRTIGRSALVLLVITAALGLVLPASPAQAAPGTNDYPYRYQTNTTAVDKWGFTQRQCVSFAAWRMAQAGRPLSNAGNAWGSAYNWDTAAARRGKTVTSTPRVGAIAHWNPYERSTYYPSGGGYGTITAGRYGHVGYVLKVLSDRSVIVEHYNLSGNRSYSQMRVKAPRYLYL